MNPGNRSISRSSTFIRVGASVQFLLVAVGVIPPLSRWVNSWFLALHPVLLREAISDAVFVWIIGAPVVGTVLYTRLTSERKAGAEGLFLLFWWITLVAMIAVALALGAAL